MVEANETEKFLVCRVGSELIGVPLLSVSEVISEFQVKPMPNMASCFKGIVNLRGSVIGIVDLRERLKLKPGEGILVAMVFKTEKGFLGVIVDRVLHVLNFEKSKVQTGAFGKLSTSREFILGIAKSEQDFITLIDVHKMLTQEEFVSFENLISTGRQFYQEKRHENKPA